MESADVRRASDYATRIALRSLLQTLYVDRCMARDDPNAAAVDLLKSERDAFDGISSFDVGEVSGEVLKHMVLGEVETFLQGVAREVAVRTGRPIQPRADV